MVGAQGHSQWAESWIVDSKSGVATQTPYFFRLVISKKKSVRDPAEARRAKHHGYIGAPPTVTPDKVPGCKPEALTLRWAGRAVGPGHLCEGSG